MKNYTPPSMIKSFNEQQYIKVSKIVTRAFLSIVYILSLIIAISSIVSVYKTI